MSEQPESHLEYVVPAEIELPVHVSNHLVHSSDRELYVDFSTAVPGTTSGVGRKVVVRFRAILNPLHAQELVLNLQKQIATLKNQLPPKTEDPPTRS